MVTHPALLTCLQLAELGSPGPASRHTGSARPAHQTGGERDEDCVLVPYNDSPEAWAAIDAVVDLGRARTVRAWVLYVRPWIADRGGQRFSYETADEARQCVDAGVARLRAGGVPASGYTRDACRESIGRAILEEAERLGVGRIALGTSGHSWLVSVLLGSVTRPVARDGRCEVTVPSAPRRRVRRRWPAGAQQRRA